MLKDETKLIKGGHFQCWNVTSFGPEWPIDVDQIQVIVIKVVIGGTCKAQLSSLQLLSLQQVALLDRCLQMSPQLL